MKPLKVLSCFDGISAGRLALERAGIPVECYYSFEIDKYAIKVTQSHYPDTVQLGDIEEWKKHRKHLPVFDLIIGGSPCQGFSNAGKGLNFDDPRSQLFFVFADIIKYYKKKNPKLKFMLENVRMKKEWQDVITKYMGVEPVKINSALLSAQNRVRLYWTNIGKIEQPEDKGIYLKDILEHGEVDRDKSYCIDANYFKGGNEKRYKTKASRQLVKESGLKFVGGIGEKDWAKDGKGLSRNFPQGRRVYSAEGKAASLSAQGVGSIGGATGIYEVKGAALRKYPRQTKGETRVKRLEIRGDDKSNCLTSTTTNKTSLVAIRRNGHEYVPTEVKAVAKSDTLRNATNGNYAVKDGYTYRNLTPVECERLQTLPDFWTEVISNTRRYMTLGNSWTVDVVAHIFGYLKENKRKEENPMMRQNRCRLPNKENLFPQMSVDY